MRAFLHKVPFLRWRYLGAAAFGGLAIAIIAYTFEESVLDPYGITAAAAQASPELQATLAWIVAGGYALIFLGMVVEGPMVTSAAAFGASLGYFNIFIVLIFAACADLLADIGFYYFGRLSRSSVIERHGHRVGFSQERIERMERLLQTHPRKTILLLKLVPGAAVVGLPLVGAARVPLRTFVLTSLSFILPSVAIFGSVGYFFGQVYTQVAAYVQNAQYGIAVAIVGILTVYFIYKKITAHIARRLGTI